MIGKLTIAALAVCMFWPASSNAQEAPRVRTRPRVRVEAGPYSVFALGENRGRIGVIVDTKASASGDKVGARVEGVTPGGPAEKAGLKVGDVITRFNGTALGGAKSEDEEDSGPGMKLIDLARELDPAVPDFKWCALGKAVHTAAIRFDRGGCDRFCALVGEARRQCGDCNARGEPLDIDGEIHARQGLVEIVDVEQDVLLRGGECPEVHQMAVAAGLDGNSRGRLMPQVLRHHRGRAAQEGERADQHALVAFRHQLGQPRAVGLSQDRDRVAISRAAQLSVLLTRRLLAQPRALLVALGERAGG